MKNTNSKTRLDQFDSKIGLDRGAPMVKEALWYLIKMVFFLSALPYPSTFKVFLLKLFGAKIGSGVIIKPRVNIHFPWKLRTGNNVWIGEEVWLLNFENLVIGDHVCISQRAFICGGNHNYKIQSMEYRNGPIELKSGCWIGACCFVGPNTTIGVDTVITVGSVITKSVEDNIVITKRTKETKQTRW